MQKSLPLLTSIAIFQPFTLFTGIQANQLITVPSLGMYPLYPRGYQGIAELHHTDLTQQATMFFLQALQYFGQRKHLALLTFGCRTEVIEKKFLLGMHLVELLIMKLNFLIFLRREPIALPLIQFRLQLGIDLSKVKIRTINAMLHLHTKEAAASRRVVQQVPTIARPDEGGYARLG